MVAHALRPTAAPLVLRVGLAVIVLYHGCLKLMVTPGGVGWDSKLHLPPVVQAAVAWTEVIAGALLVIDARHPVIDLVTLDGGQFRFLSRNRHESHAQS